MEEQLLIDYQSKGFQLSKDSLGYWLSTRKQKSAYDQPGLFQTHDFTKDSNFVWLMLFLELTGAVALFAVGANFIIVLLFLIDLVLAYLSHRPSKEICNLNNVIFLLNGSETECAKVYFNKENFSISGTIERLRERHQRRVKKLKRTQRIWNILLIVVAIIKIASFALGSENLIFTGLFFFLYSIVAYIHIAHTGYWYSSWYFRGKRLKSEYSQFISGSKSSIGSNFIDFESVKKIDDVKVEDHEIICPDPTTFPNKYRLTTEGVLTDSQLNSMVKAQTQDKAIVLKNGILLQLQKMLINNIIKI